MKKQVFMTICLITGALLAGADIVPGYEEFALLIRISGLIMFSGGVFTGLILWDENREKSNSFKEEGEYKRIMTF